jgi:predicted DNA helicase
MNIILSTCVGSGDNFLNREISEKNPFDYIIIDECAQATESLCWISILQGKKLILAGDHLQLPPTIKSKEAEYILSYTLFDRLINIYGEKCCKMLKIQYRMNEIIMNFSSKELYNNELSADESVKNYNLKDLINERFNFDKNLIEDIENNDLWKIFDKSLIMINTDGLKFFETVDNETLSRFNFGEVEICKKVVDYLINVIKVNNSDIGIITPYSAQVSFLNENFPFEKYENIEISTVDGFQGREKEIIILSLVRSNLKHQIGFLSDKRRLNVAITRPKRLLIIIGDFETCKEDDFLNKLYNYLKNFAYNLEIIGNIFEHDEYYDVMNKCVESFEKKNEDNNDNYNYDNDDDNDKGKGKKGKKNNYDNNEDYGKKGKGKKWKKKKK